MVKREELDQLKCEISVLPRKSYTYAARALVLADELMKERDAALKRVRELEGDLMDERFRE